jgi:Flp pilus assembly protein TadG
VSRPVGRYLRSQRSQSMTEFAIVAPVLLLLLFGVVDLGRALYYYVTISQAANEGGRVAAAYSTPLPTDTAVETAVQQHAVDTLLANPCRNGPVTSQVPPANSGWIYITQVPAPATLSTSQPLPANAPGGEPSAAATASCSAVNPSFGNQELEITIRYNFVPLTPLIQQLATNQLVIKASAVYRTEY